MSLYPQHFMDELRSRLSISEEIGKRVRLTKKGSLYWGCCPFHNEKTASFSVSEAKGFYHCFGCGAHGDIVSFFMNLDGLPFKETVEKLAEIARIPVPKVSHADVEKEKKQASLYDVLEEACCFFQKNLYTKSGEKALSYLKERGLTDNFIKEFRLGYSGNSNALRKALTAKGIDNDLMIESGLYTKPNEEGLSYEYFRSRVMFPIQDKRGRVIAFGGRIMDKGEPKYLNSPETPLFRKGHTLFSYNRAIASAPKKGTVILSEGYMDIIALNMHGYSNSVAPLGTALTTDQVELLWKIADEPVICFDGDSAGVRAAQRAANLVLPLLTEGKSFNFLFLPDNMDPDELLKAKGTEYFDKLLADPLPLSDFLWQRLTEGKKLDTPERFAALEKDAKELLSQIKSNSVRNYYANFLKNKVWNISHTRKRKKDTIPQNRKTVMTQIKEGEKETCKIIAYMVYYPDIMSKWIEKISFPNSSPVLKKAVEIITSALLENPDITRDELKEKLSSDIKNCLESDFEILDRTLKLPKEIDEQMHEHFSMMELKNIENEIKETAKELAPYLNEPPPELWEKYCALIEQKQKLTEEIYE